MTPNEAQARIKSRIWQAIAQSEIDTGGLEKESLESLVDLVTAAALLEIDDDIDEALSAEAKAEAAVSGDLFDDEKEDILWEGRPFLSISVRYKITDERVSITRGLLGRSYENIELVRIQDIDYSQTLNERLFNLGDITIRSHDPSDPHVVLNNVKDPETVYEILRRAVLHARRKHGFTYREEM